MRKGWSRRGQIIGGVFLAAFAVLTGWSSNQSKPMSLIQLDQSLFEWGAGLDKRVSINEQDVGGIVLIPASGYKTIAKTQSSTAEEFMPDVVKRDRRLSTGMFWGHGKTHIRHQHYVNKRQGLLSALQKQFVNRQGARLHIQARPPALQVQALPPHLVENVIKPTLTQNPNSGAGQPSVLPNNNHQTQARLPVPIIVSRGRVAANTAANHKQAVAAAVATNPQAPTHAVNAQHDNLQVRQKSAAIPAVLPNSVIAEAYAKASRIAASTVRARGDTRRQVKEVRKGAGEKHIGADTSAQVRPLADKDRFSQAVLVHTSESLSKLSRALESRSFKPDKETLKRIADQLAVVSGALAGEEGEK